jgi:hypothetical protein
MVSDAKGIDLDMGHVAADAALRLIDRADGSVAGSGERVAAQTNADGRLRNGGRIFMRVVTGRTCQLLAALDEALGVAKSWNLTRDEQIGRHRV